MKTINLIISDRINLYIIYLVYVSIITIRELNRLMGIVWYLKVDNTSKLYTPFTNAVFLLVPKIYRIYKFQVDEGDSSARKMLSRLLIGPLLVRHSPRLLKLFTVDHDYQILSLLTVSLSYQVH